MNLSIYDAKTKSKLDAQIVVPCLSLIRTFRQCNSPVLSILWKPDNKMIHLQNPQKCK